MTHNHRQENIGIEIYNSVNRGIQFLLCNLCEGTYWSDFETNSSGLSSTWVSAYVLNNLAGMLDTKLMTKIYEQIKKESHNNGCWGFSSTVPPDCDSTTHVLKSFFLGGFSKKYSEQINTALPFVLSHQQPDGGFSTYNSNSILSAFRKGKKESSYSGWVQSHPCVTSEVVDLLIWMVNLKIEI